jgi:hypothetical protein
MSFIDSDPTLVVGDFVFHGYGKNELLWKIIEIERRYLTKDDLKYGVYKDGKVGDEYNPIVTIESVANFSIKMDLKKKSPKLKKELDAGYLKKVDPKLIEEHIQRLNKIISDLWG